MRWPQRSPAPSCPPSQPRGEAARPRGALRGRSTRWPGARRGWARRRSWQPRRLSGDRPWRNESVPREAGCAPLRPRHGAGALPVRPVLPVLPARARGWDAAPGWLRRLQLRGLPTEILILQQFTPPSTSFISSAASVEPGSCFRRAGARR